MSPVLCLSLTSLACGSSAADDQGAGRDDEAGGQDQGDEDSDGESTEAGGEGPSLDPDLTPEDGGGDDSADEGEGDDGVDVDTPHFDLGPIPDGPDHGDGERCEKVDFLFVVDNSPSMVDEQTNLVTSFPGFINEIEDVVAVDDFHIMVVDTDAGSFEGGGQINCNAGQCSCTAPGCCSTVCGGGGSLELTTCNFASCDSYPPAGCGQRYGGALTINQDSGRDCGFTSAGRYMDATQPDLVDAFTCVARTGSGGSPFEAAMTSTVRSIISEAEPGGCNEGFLRKDAVLVVTVITDEEDQRKSLGNPEAWYQTIVAAKGGNPDAIVAIGVFDQSATNLRSFVEKFPRQRLIDITEADFSQGFGDAVHIIDVVCDIFDPPE